ncbi:MAG: hypothetical protein ACJAVK_001376, partial [Akkermansiaceae bacterium]
AEVKGGGLHAGAILHGCFDLAGKGGGDSYTAVVGATSFSSTVPPLDEVVGGAGL